MASGSAERDRLIGLIREYIFEHGMVDLSLSQLARGISSNNRMLLYHFGSLDEILTSAVDDILDNGPLMLALEQQLHGEGTLNERLMSAWRQVSDPIRLPYLRIFFARVGMASDHPDRHVTFLDQTRERWVQIVENAITDDDRVPNPAHTAVAVVSLWRGLQIQLVAGESADLINRVHDLAIDSLIAKPAG